MGQQQSDLGQLNKLVSWIDEQRNQDKEQVARLGQQIERLGAELHDLAAQMTDVQDRLRASQNALSRFTVVDNALRQSREQFTELQKQVQEIEQIQNRTAGVQQAETARLAKAAADLAQQINDLYHRDEEAMSRSQRLTEEMKHDRAVLAQLPRQLEHLERAGSAIGGKVQLLEEQRKREDAQTAALLQATEEIRGEQRRLWQWQQTAEVRWARQLAEWTQQVEQWQRLIDEQVKVIQEMARDVGQVKENMQASQRELVEHRERLGAHSTDLLRLESIQESAREDSHRIEQSLDLQRRRVDEQAGTLREVDERLRQGSAEDAALSRRLEHEHGRLDELLIGLHQQEQQQRGDRGDLDDLHKEVRSVRYDLEDGTSRLRQEIAALGSRQRERLAELTGMMQRYHVRHIAELEQQVRELQEQEGVPDTAPTETERV